MSATAVILAAGRGRRMGAETEHRPKCLLELAGRPLLEWQVDALRGGGVARFVIVRGYRGECLQVPGAEYVDNPAWADTHMVSSLLCADGRQGDGQVIMSYSDIVYGRRAVRALFETPGDIVVASDRDWLRLWRERFADPLQDAETFRLGEDGALEEIGRRPRRVDEIQGQYMGLLRCSPAGWQRLMGAARELPEEALRRLQMTQLLQRLVTCGVRVDVASVAGGWCEVDSAGDLALYQRRAAEDRPWSHDWRETAHVRADG